MKTSALVFRVGIACLFTSSLAAQSPSTPVAPTPQPVAQAAITDSFLGFRDRAAQGALDRQFLSVPDATLAGQELKVLTAIPHLAGSKEDRATALYVARKFREAGLETHIVSYRVLMNLPKKVQVTAFDPSERQIMSGPTPEHVNDDAYQNDPRIAPAFTAYSPSGDITAEAVYANYGRPEDFAYLAAHNVDVTGKIVLIRYGEVFRGVKVYVAQQHGAAGVILYSDPADDGFSQGAAYPAGPYRPASGVQRGSVQYFFKYAGDPTTPGISSTPGLPAKKHIALSAASNQPTIPSTPLSYQDAEPILQAMSGPPVPDLWQGGLRFPYHLGGSGVKVHLLLQQDYQTRTLWDVIGKIPGKQSPDDWVIVGNHRDAWVFGAVDPGSGTAAMLEAAHGAGVLLKQGWRPARTILFASWDGEEEGLLGSTEWAEQQGTKLSHAAAYFNIDIGVSGPNFEAAAVPSLKPFIVDITRLVPSPEGGTVYSAWLKTQQQAGSAHGNANLSNLTRNTPTAETRLIQGIRVDNLGSGSDFTPFIQHFGVPSTYISSSGPYGVYHSAFDNYTWFTKFADPHFLYLQQQARVLGLEAIHMADADLLPYNYALYGDEIIGYLKAAQKRATQAGFLELNFTSALKAAHEFQAAGERSLASQEHPSGDLVQQNRILRQPEEDLLSAQGLPGRPWFRHTIYAPGEYTGYAAVVIPGVNEALDVHDPARAVAQLKELTDALNRAAATLRQMP